MIPTSGKRNSLQTATECYRVLRSTIQPADGPLTLRLAARGALGLGLFIPSDSVIIKQWSCTVSYISMVLTKGASKALLKSLHLP